MVQSLGTNAPREENNTERSLHTTSTVSTFRVKAIGEIAKSHHLRVGKGSSCVNKYFPSDHVLDAKDTQMIMTKSLFKALCAKYFTKEIN